MVNEDTIMLHRFGDPYQELQLPLSV